MEPVAREQALGPPPTPSQVSSSLEMLDLVPRIANFLHVEVFQALLVLELLECLILKGRCAGWGSLSVSRSAGTTSEPAEDSDRPISIALYVADRSVCW